MWKKMINYIVDDISDTDDFVIICRRQVRIRECTPGSVILNVLLFKQLNDSHGNIDICSVDF